MRVRRWKEEWSSSPRLQQEFPSLATFLVFRASDCELFHRSRYRSPVSVPGRARPANEHPRRRIQAVG